MGHDHSQHDKMQTIARMDARGECYCRLFGGEYLCRGHSDLVHAELSALAALEAGQKYGGVGFREMGGVAGLIDRAIATPPARPS